MLLSVIERYRVKTAIMIFLTAIKAAAIGYTAYHFFRHIRSDGKEALKYLGLFFLAVAGITALEFLVSFAIKE